MSIFRVIALIASQNHIPNMQLPTTPANRNPVIQSAILRFLGKFSNTIIHLTQTIGTLTVPENLRKSRGHKIAQISCSILASSRLVSPMATSHKPEPSSPQAFYVSDKLAATSSKLQLAL
jgi:hypothetical protein